MSVGEMIKQWCERCGKNWSMVPDTHTLVCWRCSMGGAARVDSASKAERAGITGKMVKAAFRKKKWTQAIAAGRLGVSTTTISLAATGRGIPDQKIVDFVMETLTQQEIDDNAE